MLLIYYFFYDLICFIAAVFHVGFAGAAENFKDHNLTITETDQMLQGTNFVNKSEIMLRDPELSASPKRKRIISNKYNLRKSLAWDSEFFTSEGTIPSRASLNYSN